MKKCIAFMMALAMVLSLVACSAKPAESTAPAVPTGAEEAAVPVAEEPVA